MLPEQSSNEPLLQFPISLHRDMTFVSITEVQAHLAKEVHARKLPAYTAEMNIEESDGDNPRYLLTCKHCSQQIVLITQQDELQLIHLTTSHTHGPVASSTKGSTTSIKEIGRIPKPIFKKRRQFGEAGDDDKHSSDESSISSSADSEDECLSISNHQVLNRVMSFHQKIKKVLFRHGFTYEVDWDANEPRLSVLVAANVSMMQSYIRFGDVLSFDLLPMFQGAKGKTESAIFSVNDTNARVLVVGLAVFERFTQPILARVLQLFFSIHKKAPQTLLTDYSPAIQSAVQLIQNQPYRFAHIFNPQGALERLTRSGRLSIQDNRVVNIKKATSARCFEQYEQVIKELNHPTSGLTLSQWNKLARQQSIFFCRTGSSFVGIRRDNSHELRNLVNVYFPRPAKLATLIRKVHDMEQSLSKHAKKLVFCQDPIESTTLQEPRLEAVRRVLEGRPFERFMDNYIKCICEFSLVREQNNTRIVASLSEGWSYRIQDWKCSCMEQQKTGIPCPHLLSAAYLCDYPYVRLINPRWIISQPPAALHA